MIVCLLAAAGAIIGVVVSNSGSKDGGDSDDPVIDDVWKSEAFEYDALIQINEAYSINEN